MLRESESAKRHETNEQNENVSKKRRILCFEKEVLSPSSSSACADDHSPDLIFGEDCTNSTEIHSMEADDICQGRQSDFTGETEMISCISGSSIGFTSMDAERFGQVPHLMPENSVNSLAQVVAKSAYGQHDEWGWGSISQKKAESFLMAEAYGNCSETSTKVPRESFEETTQYNSATRRHLQFEYLVKCRSRCAETHGSQHAKSRLAVDQDRSTSFLLHTEQLGRTSIIQQPDVDSHNTASHHSLHLSNMPNTYAASSTMVTKMNMDGSLSTHEVSVIQDVAKDPKSNPSHNSTSFEQDLNLFTRALSDSENVDGYKQSIQVTSQKKRRRAPTTRDSEGGKGCNCERSKCLKLYCECFASGTYCLESCACKGCYNECKYEGTVHETRQKIKSQNPLAFASKVVKLGSDCSANMVATPSSARHVRGCNCKKSLCLKNYCVCLQMGVGCSDGCRCEGCKNYFGRKKEMRYKNTELRDGRSQEQLGTAPMDRLRSNYSFGNHYLSPESGYDHQDWNSNERGVRTDIFSSTWQENADYGHCTTPFSESYPGMHHQGNNYLQSLTGSLGWSNSSISPMFQPLGLRMSNDDISEILKDTSNATNTVEVCSLRALDPPHALDPPRVLDPPHALDPSPVFGNIWACYPSLSAPPIFPLTPVSNTTEGDNLFRTHPYDRHRYIPEKRDSS